MPYRDLFLFVIVVLFILTVNPSFKEPIDGTIPVSFPRNDTIKLPSNMVQGDITVQGPVLLGIEGTGADLTYLEANQTQLLFNSSGYDRSSDAVIYTNDNGLTIKASKLNLEAEVNTGTLGAPSANLSFMHVNRSDTDRYPNGSGIHTWDLYANGAIGAGTNGQVAAYLNRDGNIGSNGTATFNTVNGQSLKIENVDVLVKIDELNSKVGQINQGIAELHRDIDRRNAEILRRLQEAAREAERIARDAWNSAKSAFGF